MAIKVPSAAEVAAKWGEVTPGRSRYYADKAPKAAADWEAATLEAADNYQAAVTAGNIGAKFAGGVRKAGASKYARKIVAVGAGRFAAGVQAAVADMASGIAPYLDEISRITLPKRAPRGSSQNLERVRVISEALAARRRAELGAS